MGKIGLDNGKICTRRYNDGSTIAYLDYTARGPAWWVRRGALREYLLQAAKARGVRILEGSKVVSVDLDRPAVTLQNGQRLEANLLIGADGTWSRVRQTMFPDYKTKTLDVAVFQISLDLQQVQQDETLSQLLDGPSHIVLTTGPGLSIFASPVPSTNGFDIQLFDHDYPPSNDPIPSRNNEWMTDLTALRERFKDFHPAVGKALAIADKAHKWRLSTNADVPRWFHENGKVVLIGDAVHGMVPFSGQGSAMAFEDADILTCLLANAGKGDSLVPKLRCSSRFGGRRWKR